MGVGYPGVGGRCNHRSTPGTLKCNWVELVVRLHRLPAVLAAQTLFPFPSRPFESLRDLYPAQLGMSYPVPLLPCPPVPLLPCPPVPLCSLPFALVATAPGPTRDRRRISIFIGVKHFSWYLALGLFVLGLASGIPIAAQTVYITKTGEKYHKESCQYLKYSKIEIDLAKAVELGKTPCSVCKPPRLSPGQAPISSSGASSLGSAPAPSQGKSTSRQCSATTQAGKRCLRMTTNTNGRCWQHQG